MDINKFVNNIKINFHKLDDELLLNKKSNYEKQIADIIGFENRNESYYDIEKNGFKVEIKKQQNIQWIDAIKMSQLFIDGSETLNTYLMFIYYSKGDGYISIESIHFVTYGDLINKIGLTDKDMNHLCGLSNRKIQAKMAISKSSIEEISKYKINKDSI